MANRRLPFALVLVLTFGVLAAIADAVVARTTVRWLHEDLARRARQAVEAAAPALAVAGEAGGPALDSVLAAMARDDRVVGVALCDADDVVRGRSQAFPRDVSCAQARGHAPGTFAAPFDSAGLHLEVVPLVTGERSSALLVLQDSAFAGRRLEATRRLVFMVLFAMALVASFVTVWFSRLARRRWVQEFRAALSSDGLVPGATERREFRPLLRDVRRLARTLADEQADADRSGPWSQERLRATMQRVLEGERLVVLANREPYIHMRTDTGVRVMHPASGLVTALEPVLRACSGTWVAHGSGTADRDVVDGRDRIAVPPDNPVYTLRRVWLSDDEENGYYYGVANEALWPLCHVAHARPRFRHEDWEHYRRVNQRFAEAVCQEVDVDDPIILVQDYHFALAPRFIRERLPKAIIITFWHIPWPNAERIGICPWRDEVLDGLLGSSILAFHTQQHCNHFLDAIDLYTESRIDREATAINQGEQRTLIRGYPISIAWPVPWMEMVPPVAECRRDLRARIGLPDDALVGLGVDRLDYTKGIEERLGAVDALLEQHPEFRGRFTFVQIAAPSRTKIGLYQDLEREVLAQVEVINARWRADGYEPIRLWREHVEPPDVFRLMRAADVCYVSSLHDGMNLVAKEFVASRDDEQGVLVLSQFTGAARELTEALVVNPYDLRQGAAALAAALQMPADEQRERMNAMRGVVAEFNAYRWAARMLLEASDLRRRQRIAARLTDPVVTP